MSADIRDTRTIRQMYNTPGGSFAFGKPTLAKISLKMSIACIDWVSCAVSLMTSVVAVVADRKRNSVGCNSVTEYDKMDV